MSVNLMFSNKMDAILIVWFALMYPFSFFNRGVVFF